MSGFLAAGEGGKLQHRDCRRRGWVRDRTRGSKALDLGALPAPSTPESAGGRRKLPPRDTRRRHRNGQHGEATSGKAAAGLFLQLGVLAKKGMKGTQLQGQPCLQISARNPAPTLPGQQGGREEPAPKQPPAAPRVPGERRERDREHTGAVSGQSRPQSLLSAVLAALGPGARGKEQPAKSRQPSVVLLSPERWPRGGRRPWGLRRRWSPPASSW